MGAAWGKEGRARRQKKDEVGRWRGWGQGWVAQRQATAQRTSTPRRTVLVKEAGERGASEGRERGDAPRRPPPRRTPRRRRRPPGTALDASKAVWFLRVSLYVLCTSAKGGKGKRRPPPHASPSPRGVTRSRWGSPDVRYSATRSCMLDSASVNSISSMPSPVYQCRNARRRNMDENWVLMRWNRVWIEVELPMNVTACVDRRCVSTRRSGARARERERRTRHLEAFGRDLAVGGLDVVGDPLDKVVGVLHPPYRALSDSVAQPKKPTQPSK